MRSDSVGLFWEDVAKIRAAKAVKLKRLAPERTWEQPGYLPGIEEAVAFRYLEMSDSEILAAQQAREELVFDIECYINYFLIAFESVQTGRRVTFGYSVMYGMDCDRK